MSEEPKPFSFNFWKKEMEPQRDDSWFRTIPRAKELVLE